MPVTINRTIGGKDDDYMDNTLDYYDKNAYQFVQGTLSVDFTGTQDIFLKKLKEAAFILDFGCGSGRDIKYFMDKKYRVDATDGSKELCRIASEYTGIEVKQMLFSELDVVDKYDGIWACSSILHLTRNELKPVLQKMAAALKSGGIVYTSFKYGEFEGVRGGRYFTDFTSKTFLDFMQDMKALQVEECWITGDVRPGRGGEKWLNLILRKSDIH
jgi:SAM-dependent methyltransferase